MCVCVPPSNGNPSDQQINKAAGASLPSSCQQLPPASSDPWERKKKELLLDILHLFLFFFSLSLCQSVSFSLRPPLSRPIPPTLSNSSFLPSPLLHPSLHLPPVSPADDFFKPRGWFHRRRSPSPLYLKWARKWTPESGSSHLGAPTLSAPACTVSHLKRVWLILASRVILPNEVSKQSPGKCNKKKREEDSQKRLSLSLSLTFVELMHA